MLNTIPVLLFRKGMSGDNGIEIQAAQKAGFQVVHQRTNIPPQSFVLGRYSVLPYYLELELDLHFQGSFLCNTTRQHHYLADIGNWVDHLTGLTPLTWRRIEDIPKEEQGPFVAKGKTNSRKDRWKTHMFAANRTELYAVRNRLMDDTFIDAQGIYIRNYVPMKTFLEGVGGMPVTNEWRFFVFNSKIISHGFYWQNYVDDLPSLPDPSQAELRSMTLLVEETIARVGTNASFYTVDIGEKEEGTWQVIELNDGQMAGLSCNPPEEFYSRLFQASHSAIERIETRLTDAKIETA